MKRKINRFMAFLLGLLLLIPFPLVQGETAPSSPKLDSSLLPIYESGQAAPVAIQMKLSDLPLEDAAAFQAAVLAEMALWGLGEKELLLSPEDAWFYVDWLLSIGSLTGDSAVTVAALSLNQEEAWALAGQEKVAQLSWYDDSGVWFIDYTAEDALCILQVAVGLLTEISPSDAWTWDIDKNGQINAADALLALQDAVGLITVAYPPGTAIPE